MRDWKGIAKAAQVEVTGEELDRLVAPLEAIDRIFRPLVAGLRAADEPATAFEAAEEGE